MARSPNEAGGAPPPPHRPPPMAHHHAAQQLSMHNSHESPHRRHPGAPPIYRHPYMPPRHSPPPPPSSHYDHSRGGYYDYHHPGSVSNYAGSPTQPTLPPHHAPHYGPPAVHAGRHYAEQSMFERRASPPRETMQASYPPIDPFRTGGCTCKKSR